MSVKKSSELQCSSNYLTEKINFAQNMKAFRLLIFSIGYGVLQLALVNLKSQSPKKVTENPGWQEQYSAMKPLDESLNYMKLRASWKKHDLLYKKASGALESISEVGPFDVAGRVRALLIDAADSSRIFAGGISGGLWVSENAGKTWKPIADQNQSLAVSCITQNPFNPSEIYYGTGEGTGNSADLEGGGIFKSSDGGKTFLPLVASQSVAAFKVIWDIEYSKSDVNTFYIGTASGLYRTTNNGASFKNIYSATKGFHEILTYPDGRVWAALDGAGILDGKEDTAGIVFSKFTSTLPTSGIGRISMAYCKKFPSVAYCQFMNSGSTALVGLYKTSDHGKTWKKLSTPTTTGVYSWAWYCLGTGVSPVDSNFVCLLSVKALASANGGSSWTEMNYSHADYHSSAFYPAGKNMLIGNDGGVYNYSVKNFTSAEVSLNNGLNITQFYTGNYDENNSTKFIGGTQDNGTHLFNGSAFVKAYGGDGAHCAFSSTSPYYLYVSSQNGEIRRLNQNLGGEVNIKPSGTYSFWFINPFEVNRKDGNQVYVLSKTRILVSTNAGGTWSNLSNNLNKTVLSLGVSYEKNPTVYFGGGGTTLYRATKASTTTLQEFDLTSTSPTLAKASVINCIKVNYQNPSTVYLSMSDVNTKPRVWKLNGALGNTPTWKNISGNLPASLPVNCVEINPQDSNMMLAGTDFGLYSSSNGGDSWSKEESVPNVAIFKLVSHPSNGRVYIFTHGRGIFKSQFKNFVSSGATPSIPKAKLKVHFNNPVQNFLNLSLPEYNASDNFTIQLLSSKGQLVRELFPTRGLSFDLSDLNSGLYFIRLDLNGQSTVLKMIKN